MHVCVCFKFMLLASKDPYKLVRQVLEELGCPEQISKFTGACFTVGVALLMTNLLILPILLQPLPLPHSGHGVGGV